MAFERYLGSAIVLTALCLTVLPTVAEAKPARCEITNGDSRYSGPCEFVAHKGGSFDVNLPEAGFEAVGSGTFEVVIKRADRAVVFAYFPGRQPIANVTRDRKKPACWSGEGVRICAY